MTALALVEEDPEQLPPGDVAVEEDEDDESALARWEDDGGAVPHD